ncbi:MAG TPA: Rieske 2Fe-2S domain-containing protein [Steroidobacter sp.]|uniref:Rieske 2Fe-2S domain-containing protein n=1 Tax=Steroidobacter sp. TaxID=1978227 RepID=UPI002EDAECCC
MGELLRRYWHPIAAVAELDEHPIKPVRLMCEDLVLFRTGEGAFGLVARNCPHRGADLTHGIIEANGIRCSYHPIKHRELFTQSMTLEESRALGRSLAYRVNETAYQHQLGQPEAVKREYQIAMGMIPEDATETL